MADVAAIALAAAEGGAAGLVLINTVRGMAIDRRTLRPLLGGGGGGLSGPAVKPVALHAIYHCRAATGLPIVGMGGVASARTALEFLAAGASVVGVGTALFRDPGLPARIVAELADAARRAGAFVGCGRGRSGPREPPSNALPKLVAARWSEYGVFWRFAAVADRSGVV